jgi:hypothetical protein
MQTHEDHSTMPEVAAVTRQVVSARADEVAELGRSQVDESGSRGVSV